MRWRDFFECRSHGVTSCSKKLVLDEKKTVKVFERIFYRFSRSTKVPVLLVDGFRTTKKELRMRGVFSLLFRKSACQGPSSN